MKKLLSFILALALLLCFGFNAATLADYNIQKESTLHLVLRNSGYNISFNQNGAVITVSEAGEYNIIFVSMSGRRMIDVRIKNISVSETGNYTVTIPSDLSVKGADKLKTFLWTENIKPLAKCELSVFDNSGSTIKPF